MGTAEKILLNYSGSTALSFLCDLTTLSIDQVSTPFTSFLSTLTKHNAYKQEFIWINEGNNLKPFLIFNSKSNLCWRVNKVYKLFMRRELLSLCKKKNLVYMNRYICRDVFCTRFIVIKTSHVIMCNEFASWFEHVAKIFVKVFQ